MVDLTFTLPEQTELKKRNIAALVLFGSQAQETANSQSDYDVFVLGPSSKENYDYLYDLLAKKINSLTDIDIVFRNQAPLELQNHVAKFGRVLYAVNPVVFFDFRQQVMLLYSDFAPLRQMFQGATLSRISA